VLAGLAAALFGLWALTGLAGPTKASLLPLTFAHADHQAVNCVACHHEFTDATPRGPCLECHAQDPTVAHLIETQFHDLCRGCHLERRIAGLGAGPTRACGACHTADEAP
jgi:hypothetical protein